MRLRSLRLRPYRACRVSKSFQHTTVDAASPHQLISMLFDGVLRQLRLAKNHMSKGELAAKVRTGRYEWTRMAGIQVGGPRNA